MASVERQVADRWLELRERERYIRHLVDNTSDAIFLCDRQGKILDVNKRACDSLGYSRKELLSMMVADVEFQAEPEDAGPPVKRSAAGCPRTYESVHRRKDGTTFPVEIHVTSVGSDSQPLVLAIVHDITDRNERKWLRRKSKGPRPTCSTCLAVRHSSWQLVGSTTPFNSFSATWSMLGLRKCRRRYRPVTPSSACNATA